jgi:hypothetical protein
MDNKLYRGIFWVISDGADFEDHILLAFKIACDRCGNITEAPPIPLNSKNGGTYNHKAVWDHQIKNNPAYKPYNKTAFDHYPRGRVEISNDKAVIYLNPFINRLIIIEKIKNAFGLNENNIRQIRVINDNSAHYACYLNNDENDI